MQRPDAVVDLLKPDALADQDFADEQELALPFDTPVGAHSAHFIVARILHVRHTIGIRPRRLLTGLLTSASTISTLPHLMAGEKANSTSARS